MQRTGRILIVLGVVLGILAMLVVFQYVNASISAAQQQPPPPTLLVVVAQQSIPIYAPIITGAVALASWPADAVRPDTITDTAEVIGKLSSTNIVPGQMIVRSMLVDKDAPEGNRNPQGAAIPSTTIPDDKVAVAFPINDLSGVAQALRDHDRIDLMVTYEQVVSSTQTANSTINSVKRITQLTLQDIEIMRVGLWNANPEAGNAAAGAAATPNTILTLLVSQQDALVLKFLRETSAEVQFALRPAGNHRIAKTQPIIVEYIDQRFNFGGSLSGLK